MKIKTFVWLVLFLSFHGVCIASSSKKLHNAISGSVTSEPVQDSIQTLRKDLDPIALNSGLPSSSKEDLSDFLNSLQSHAKETHPVQSHGDKFDSLLQGLEGQNPEQQDSAQKQVSVQHSSPEQHTTKHQVVIGMGSSQKNVPQQGDSKLEGLLGDLNKSSHQDEKKDQQVLQGKADIDVSSDANKAIGKTGDETLKDLLVGTDHQSDKKAQTHDASEKQAGVDDAKKAVSVAQKEITEFKAKDAGAGIVKELAEDAHDFDVAKKVQEQIQQQAQQKAKEGVYAKDNKDANKYGHKIAKEHYDQKVEHAKEQPEKPKEVTYLQQDLGFVDDHQTIEFNFEDADLRNVANYMEHVHSIKFISDDAIVGSKDAKGLAGHKISFRTNRTLTKRESWNLFLTFLHVAGLDIVPMTQVGFYRIVAFTKAGTEAIPTYIGVNYQTLPDNDMVVRFVYFVQNADPKKIQPILAKMQAGQAKIDVYSDLKALIFTDRASNIKSLMQLVAEFDKASMPEVVSVLKLKRANVEDVVSLYNTLKPATQQPQRAWAPGSKEATLEYFSQDVTTFGDKRTNSLILMGPDKAVKRVEEFVMKHIDVDLEKDTAPLHVYQLQYTNATDIQQTLQTIVQYGANTPAGQYGGVRDGIKFFQNMSIVPDNHTNSLIINATKEDYEALKPLIDDLDVQQKQVGLEVLIVQVKDSDVKTLGMQLSGPNGPNVHDSANRKCQTFLPSVSAQTSGVSPGTPIVVTRGASSGTNSGTVSGTEEFSIKSSLASLLGAGGVLNEVGSTLVTFGKPIWGLFKILKTISSAHVLSNPFVVVSNNSQATVKIGETRRVVTGEVVNSSGTNTTAFTNMEANLTLNITPHINKENIINLDLDVKNSQFLVDGASNENSALQDSKTLKTHASVANGEVLVIGGIMSESYASASSGVPFLEKIPVLGWLFKSKTRTVGRDHYLIFIAPKLLSPAQDDAQVDAYTKYKMQESQRYLDIIEEADWFSANKDPIQRAFFKEGSEQDLRDLNHDKKAHFTIKKSKRKKDKSTITKKKKKKNKKEKQVSLSMPELAESYLQESISSRTHQNAISSVMQPGDSNV